MLNFLQHKFLSLLVGQFFEIGSNKYRIYLSRLIFFIQTYWDQFLRAIDFKSSCKVLHTCNFIKISFLWSAVCHCLVFSTKLVYLWNIIASWKGYYFADKHKTFPVIGKYRPTPGQARRRLEFCSKEKGSVRSAL